jgi:hypothetical protein
MNEVILGVLSTKFAAVAGGFLSGFSMLLVAMLLLRRRVQEQLRPLLVERRIRSAAPTWLPVRTNNRCVDMASRAPPPRVPKRQRAGSDAQSPPPNVALRS